MYKKVKNFGVLNMQKNPQKTEMDGRMAVEDFKCCTMLQNGG